MTDHPLKQEGEYSFQDTPEIGDKVVPKHIAFIMDGNGRWAQKRNLPHVAGHRQGMEVAREVVRACSQLGISFLSLYVFSSENWNRPDEEVSYIMELLQDFLKSELEELHKENVRTVFIGNKHGLSDHIQDLMDNMERTTRNNTGLTLILAINYGARAEIVEAVRSIAAQCSAGGLKPSNIDETTVSNALATRGIPDPDVIVRTSGEQRLSNFFLWQSSYAEFVFTPVLWPDFGREELWAVLKEYANRQRRYGAR